MFKKDRGRQQIADALEQLAYRVNSEVNKGFERRLIKPEEETFSRRKVKKLHYTNQGIKGYSADWEDSLKTSWQQASRKIEESVKKSDEYNLAKRIRIIKKREKDNRDLESFVKHLIAHRLYHSKLNDGDIRKSVSTFIKDLEDQPVFCQVTAGLEGIILKPEEIRFRMDGLAFILRKTKVQDIDNHCVSCEVLSKVGRIPTVILEFGLFTRDPVIVKEKIDQVIAALRLFKISGVQCHSYHTQPESIVDEFAGGTFHSRLSHRPIGRTIITNNDVERLKRFLMKVGKALPSSFYKSDAGEFNHLYIAYNRYYTALLQEGIIERRIANAVMGLEGLFLRSQEKQDLVYRLSLRLAKILDYLGDDPYQAKAVVEDASYVKNVFAHGELLLLREKKKLMKKYRRHGFLNLLLDYLRISMVVMLTTIQEKEGFLNLIDDSFIDMAKDAQLNNLLNSARKFSFA